MITSRVQHNHKSTTHVETNHSPYSQPDTLAASTVTAVDTNAMLRRTEIFLAFSIIMIMIYYNEGAKCKE